MRLVPESVLSVALCFEENAGHTPASERRIRMAARHHYHHHYHHKGEDPFTALVGFIILGFIIYFCVRGC